MLSDQLLAVVMMSIRHQILLPDIHCYQLFDRSALKYPLLRLRPLDLNAMVADLLLQQSNYQEMLGSQYKLLHISKTHNDLMGDRICKLYLFPALTATHPPKQNQFQGIHPHQNIEKNHIVRMNKS